MNNHTDQEQVINPYQSYLIRLWRNEPDEDWRVILEHVDSKERKGFNNLEDMIRFLKMEADRREMDNF